jgi:putative salt-induced outer membrane protein YdiY
MKFSISVKNNSDVPLGTEKTDTESAVTLVYKF